MLRHGSYQPHNPNTLKKKGIGDSFRYPDPKQIKLDQANGRIFLPKLGWMRYRNSRNILGELRNVNSSQPLSGAGTPRHTPHRRPTHGGTEPHHIAGIPKGNQQLAQLWHFRERPANVGSRFQQQELLLNDLTGPPSGFWGLDGKELPASFQSFRRAFGDNYLWHSGTAFSSSVPQVFTQVRTSWPVRCRPVS